MKRPSLNFCPCCENSIRLKGQLRSYRQTRRTVLDAADHGQTLPVKLVAWKSLNLHPQHHMWSKTAEIRGIGSDEKLRRQHQAKIRSIHRRQSVMAKQHYQTSF